MKHKQLILIFLAFAVLSCGTQQKLKKIRQSNLSAEIRMRNEQPEEPKLEVRDTVVDKTSSVEARDSREPIIMNAVKDEDGVMVAHDVIEAATVVARFKNVAERHGMVSVEFMINVPAEMQDSEWQLRFYPRMAILDDTLQLEPVLITGENYRNEQMRGYNRYEKFLSSIISDSTQFIRMNLLEIFIERNIPELYAFKTDSSYVSDKEFASVYGVTQQEAVKHYTRSWAKTANERRKAQRQAMFHKYVKVPIESEGLRLDTIIAAANGDFCYGYSQTFKTRPKLRKVDITLGGGIYELDQKIYNIPETEPLTYYISSLSAFVDPTEKYLTKVIERRVEENTACYIEFKQGSSEIIDDLGHNSTEIGRIKGNLASLIENVEYDMDSIVVTASSSPEGTLKFNERLSQRRSEAVATYFKGWIGYFLDSLALENGISINMDDEYSETPAATRYSEIEFIARNNSENWAMLDALVSADQAMSLDDKIAYIEACEETDLDRREQRLHDMESYKYMREHMYPSLRTVKFDFHLHRKGMVKDTIHTTAIDETYMSGVQAIRDREYEKAITLLRPYQDYNTAVAFCAMDYNASALAILEKMKPDARVNYLLAVLYSRNGQKKKALDCYRKACEDEPTYVHRGNLDPEISALIKEESYLR